MIGTTENINTKKYSKLLAQTLPAVITNDEELSRLRASLSSLMKIGDDRRTAEQDKLLSLLGLLIEQYEKEKYPLGGETAPGEILHSLLEENGYKQKDLVGIFKTEANVSEVISGNRSISKNKAKELGEFFGVSYKLFL